MLKVSCSKQSPLGMVSLVPFMMLATALSASLSSCSTSPATSFSSTASLAGSWFSFSTSISSSCFSGASFSPLSLLSVLAPTTLSLKTSGAGFVSQSLTTSFSGSLHSTSSGATLSVSTSVSLLLSFCALSSFSALSSFAAFSTGASGSAAVPSASFSGAGVLSPGAGSGTGSSFLGSTPFGSSTSSCCPSVTSFRD